MGVLLIYNGEKNYNLIIIIIFHLHLNEEGSELVMPRHQGQMHCRDIGTVSYMLQFICYAVDSAVCCMISLITTITTENLNTQTHVQIFFYVHIRSTRTRKQIISETAKPHRRPKTCRFTPNT